MDSEKHKLPSGMHQVWICAVRQETTHKTRNFTVVQSESRDEDLEVWERYLEMECSGTEEYTESEKEEKKMLDDRILKKFKETTEAHDHLPDNKSIAVARLKALLKQYEDRKDFLQELEQIFKEQLEKGIIEKLTEEMDRYRFRIGNVAITADIEKAFLQVRLHEVDRDATRFLWLRDFRKPYGEKNVVTYRFTRVTFGLISLPFLLAATINFELETTANVKNTAELMKDNLYVVNLLMTAESKKEAVEQYRDAKKIFDAHMNMREFLTNEIHVRKNFAESGRSISLGSKVLGIEWNTQKRRTRHLVHRSGTSADYKEDSTAYKCIYFRSIRSAYTLDD
ncbi:unnamed protein product [Strongylus vulgaris]|uniref:Reverse transcriptase domain-containing protein n=1 Tax=Strongylus vulgaris TaxID=40348 RepID=A0A3P7KMK2_STRVU|nr:unnamed protein product [Strongylus vulgaris]